ncbi:MAG: potassium channel family protein, partial [Methanosarcinales archaeon]
KIKYCSSNMKELLTEMKNTSELMVDLAYSSVIYDDEDIANEVLRLEEKMDTIEYHVKIAAMLGARSYEDAAMLSGVLQAATASEKIANAAGDIAKIVLLKMGIPLELKFDLQEAEETIIRAKVHPKSKMVNKTLGELKLETETGMRIIAIRRNSHWIYDPDKNTKIFAKDILFAKGYDEGVPIFYKCATCAHYVKRVIETNYVLEDLDKAVDIIVDMKNMSELSIGLAYSSVLFYNKDLAHEVEIIEEKMDEMKYALQHWVLKSAKYISDVNQLRGLLHLATSSEIISDAALVIADVVLRDIELHPVLTLAVRESDEVVTKIDVSECSDLMGKTLGELKLETETGMYVMAIKRNDKWIYNPGSKTLINNKDLLIARGPSSGEKLLIGMCNSDKL